jgi:hypothetical protein
LEKRKNILIKRGMGYPDIVAMAFSLAGSRREIFLPFMVMSLSSLNSERRRMTVSKVGAPL